LTLAEYCLIHTHKDGINKCVSLVSFHPHLKLFFFVLKKSHPLLNYRSSSGRSHPTYRYIRSAPFMLPFTCILRPQRDRIDAKRSENAATFSTRYYQIYRALKHTENPGGFLPLPSFSHLDSAPTAICGYVQPMFQCRVRRDRCSNVLTGRSR